MSHEGFAPLAQEALGRSLSWLSGNAGNARYVEATLGRFASAIADAELTNALTGFDADDEPGRVARVERMRAALDRIGVPVVETPTEAKVKLLPEGIASDLPPPRPPPPPLPVVVEEANGHSYTAEAWAESSVPARPEGEGTPAPQGRREQGGEGREREGRRERGGRGDRQDRGGRNDRGERTDREARPERGERSDRPERGERGGRDRGGRGDRPERGGDPAESPAESQRSEAPRPERVERTERVEPPPPPSFPLGHPDATGAPVESLGVFDAAEIEALATEGVETIADLLLRAPVRVERAGERWVHGVVPEGPVLLRGKVLGRTTRLSPHGKQFELRLDHGRGTVVCRWFGEVPDEVRAAGTGHDLGLAGRFELDDDVGRLYEAEPLGIDGRGGDWFPVYELPGVTENRMRSGVRAALRRHDATIADHLPPEVTDKHKLMPLAPAIRDVHFPPNASRKGRSRLAFDELLQIQLGIALLRTRPTKERGVANTASHGLVTRAFSTLGWYFNDVQEAAFDSIRRDMRRNVPMERLLQGDVGSGKLAVVRAAMLMVAEQRVQVFFCAHDALAAETHWLFSQEWFKAAGIEPLLLTGAPTRSQAEALRKGDTLVVFGTHALFKEPPEVKKVGLVVVEQQAGHGVPDLGAFEGGRPDLLVTTPMPVPALLSMTVYGQLAMTVIGPTGVHGVDVEVVDGSARATVYQAAREAIERGEQVLLAFPVSRGVDLLSPWEARRLAETLSQDALPGARVALFNGAITREERFRAYEDFQHRRADVLLATATIEDGPIVPNASILIVEQADKLDLVRMHRLRNHIANGYRRGKAFFITAEDAHPDGKAALELVSRESDGFRIADLDLARRGAAEVLGEGAEEVPRFSWTDPAQDRETLQKARNEAFRLLALDPGLKRRVHRALLNLVRSRFGEEAFAEGGGPAPVEARPDGGGGGGGGSGRRRRRRRR